MITCSDLHIRHDRPIARKDDYFASQDKKFSYILELARKSPPLIVAGDFFHKARPPIPLIRWVMDKLIEYDVVPLIVPGQHDLPFHSLDHLPESGLGLLEAAGLADILSDPYSPYIFKAFSVISCPFGTSPPKWEYISDVTTGDEFVILVWHNLIIKKGEELWYGQESPSAGKILREHPQYDFIITGDNHRTFIESSRKRHLINCGSMMRMSIDQREHKPVVFEITDDKKIVPHYLPIEEDVFDLDSAVSRVEREERINDFVSRLMTDYEISSSFEANLEHAMQYYKVPKEVKEIVRRCLGE